MTKDTQKIIDATHSSYDLSLKFITNLLFDNLPNLFGLDEIKIESKLPTEQIHVKLRKKSTDATFKAKCHDEIIIFHVEAEFIVTEEDLARFLCSNAFLYIEYKKIIETVIFAIEKVQAKELKYGGVCFKPKIVCCADFAAEEELDKIGNLIFSNKPINEIFLVSIPLFGNTGKNESERLAHKKYCLIKALEYARIYCENYTDLKISYFEITGVLLALSQKFFSQEELYKIWREYGMGTYPELRSLDDVYMAKMKKESREEGRYEGRVEGALRKSINATINSLNKGIEEIIISEIQSIPLTYVHQIKNLIRQKKSLLDIENELTRQILSEKNMTDTK